MANTFLSSQKNNILCTSFCLLIHAQKVLFNSNNVESGAGLININATYYLINKSDICLFQQTFPPIDLHLIFAILQFETSSLMNKTFFPSFNFLCLL